MATLRTDEIRVSPRGQLQSCTVQRRFRSDDPKRPKAIEVAFCPAGRNQRLAGRPENLFNAPEPGHELVATIMIPAQPGPASELTLFVEVDEHPPQTVIVRVQHAPPP